jgi:protein disulfide-isomerase
LHGGAHFLVREHASAGRCQADRQGDETIQVSGLPKLFVQGAISQNELAEALQIFSCKFQGLILSDILRWLRQIRERNGIMDLRNCEEGRKLQKGLTLIGLPGHPSMKNLFILFFAFFAMAAVAADNPYNETADARLDIKQALTQAVATHTAVIVVFGANWCGDCKMLDYAMKSGTSAPLLARDFQIVKVNVGHWDKNLDLAKAYGVPLEKGIPAVAILSSDNKVLYVTKEGELANARQMGENGIYDFLKQVTTSVKAGR